LSSSAVPGSLVLSSLPSSPLPSFLFATPNFSLLLPPLGRSGQTPDQRGWLGSRAQAGRCRFLLSPSRVVFSFLVLPLPTPKPSKHQAATPRPILYSIPYWTNRSAGTSAVSYLISGALVSPLGIALSSQSLCINCVESSPELHALNPLPLYTHAAWYVSNLLTYLPSPNAQC
jgi:hypothetical protein